MQANFRGKHLITLREWTKEEIDTLMDVSFDLKKKYALGIPTRYLQDQTIFLMFFEASTRTRNSMEAGITQLGGHAHFLDTSTMQISHGETPKDTAVILARFGHAIACRLCAWEVGNKYIREMAAWSPVPVINMQCDLYHPLQGLADLMTVIEKFGNPKGVNISVIWAYATSHKKPISVPLTQALLFPRYGMNVTLAYPEGYQLPQWVYDEAEANAKKHGGSFRITHDQAEAYKNADAVIPKNWGNWVADATGDTTSGNVLDESLKIWKCTLDLMKTTNPGCIYMHALPADRNNEVEDAVIDGEWSVVYDEAENRLHTSKAVMALTMGGRNAAHQ